MRGPMNGDLGGSIHGGGRGELDGLGRVDRTVGAHAQDGARAGARAAGQAEASARHDVGGPVAADTASDAIASAPRATASTAASAAGQGEAQTRDLNAGGMLTGAASASGPAARLRAPSVPASRRVTAPARARAPRIPVTPASRQRVATLTRVTCRLRQPAAMPPLPPQRTGR